MASMFTYLWQSALVLTVLYIPFQLLLRKEQFFALNRAILLGILLLSLTLPLSHHTMPLFVDNWLHPEVEMEVAPITPLGEYQDWDGDIIIEEGDIEEPSSIEIHWTDLLIALWLIGTIIFLAWYTRGLWRLYKVLHDKDNTREELADGNTLLLTSYALPSFSWMHSIVISQEDYAENGETILLHERAHIAHHHSYDRLLLLVVQTLQWWNPFVWLMADALSQVHEYQADLAVLRQGTNATQYQLLLIRKAAGPAGLALVNGFKRNKLKLRIVMMNNMIKLRGAKSRYLALLPVALLAFVLTAKAQEKNSEQEIESVRVVGMGFQKDFEIRTKGNTPDPLVLVEGEVYEDWKNIDPDIIETMTIYKVDSDTVAHYSEIYEAAKYGVIMIELQEGKKQKPYKRKAVSSEEANEPYTEDMLFVYDGNVVNLSDIKDLVPEECGINGMSLYRDGYYVDQYIGKYPKAKNGVVMIDSFMKNSSLFVIDGEPMNFQTMRQKYPEGLPPTKYHINHKDAETIAKYSQYPEAKNGVNIIITGKE